MKLLKNILSKKTKNCNNFKIIEETENGNLNQSTDEVLTFQNKTLDWNPTTR